MVQRINWCGVFMCVIEIEVNTKSPNGSSTIKTDSSSNALSERAYIKPISPESPSKKEVKSRRKKTLVDLHEQKSDWGEAEGVRKEEEKKFISHVKVK